MPFLLDPSLLTSASLSAGNFFSAHPELVHELVQHILTHSIYNHIRSPRGVVVSRAQRRRVANRRRRWFVDNIVMHHKRLHDQNRAIAISNVRKRLLEKRENLKKESLTTVLAKSSTTPSPSQDDSNKWRERFDGKDRGLALKGRVDTRRVRARSRWLSVKATVAA